MGHGGGRDSGRNAIQQQIRANLDALAREFSVSPGGNFGTKGTSSNVRRLYSSDPQVAARRFFTLATTGSEKPKMIRPGVLQARFADGSHIEMRPRSSSDGSPVVSMTFNSPTGRYNASQKIHFVQGGKS